MPRNPEQYSTTPFAAILTRYMWSKAPPWTTNKLGAVLGISRSRVGNWLYKDITPEIETMLAVLARLNIPIADLLDAYAAQGKPIPPLTPSEAGQRAAAQRPQQYAVPHGRKGRQPAASGASGLSEPIAASEAGAGAEEAEAAGRTEGADTDEWDTMLANTREVMTLAGMPSSAIEAMLAEIKDTREGKPSTIARHIAEEHQVQPSQPQVQPPSPSQTSQHTQSVGRRGSEDGAK